MQAAVRYPYGTQQTKVTLEFCVFLQREDVFDYLVECLNKNRVITQLK